MSEVHHITEIIPDFSKLPDWAREAFEDGQYFAVVSEKVIEYEVKLEDAEKDLANYDMAEDFLIEKLEASKSLLKCRTNDLEQLQTGYDICDAKLTQFQDLYRYSQATIKAITDAINQFGITAPSEDQMIIWQQNFKAVIKGNND